MGKKEKVYEDVFYEYNGKTINLTALCDQNGRIGVTKSINMLMEMTDLSHKEAYEKIHETYKKTPPDRNLKEQRKQQLLDDQIAGKKPITAKEWKEVALEFLRRNDFETDIMVEFSNKFFAIDKSHKLYFAPMPIEIHNIKLPRRFEIHNIDEIIEIEMIAGRHTVVKSSGGTGGTIAGGLLFGAVGAIAGSTLKNTTTQNVNDPIYINITTNNLSYPLVKIQLFLYKTQAEQVFALLKNVMHGNNNESIASEKNLVSKLKELLDLKEKGALTEEEYTIAKQKILGAN